MTTPLERTLPANIDAERFVLGSILLNDDRYADVAATQAPADFILEKHRRIYARMAELYERGENIDRITVADQLNRHGQLESVDGLAYLVTLDDGLPEIANIDSYIRIVKDKALLRDTMFACQGIIDQCATASESSIDILETAARVLERIRGTSEVGNQPWVTPAEILGHDVDSVLFPKQGTGCLRTPWPRLTEMTGGWSPGDLTIVAGRPSWASL